MEIKKIGIVGAGQMGSGIAEVAITSGFQVLMRDVNQDAIEKGKNRIISDLERQVQKGKVAGEEKEGALRRLATTSRMEDLRDSDFIIEAATEQAPLKGEIFKKKIKGHPLVAAWPGRVRLDGGRPPRGPGATGSLSSFLSYKTTRPGQAATYG